MYRDCDDHKEFDCKKKENDENCVVINIFCDKCKKEQEDEWENKHDDKCKSERDSKDECVRINIFCDKDKEPR